MVIKVEFRLTRHGSRGRPVIGWEYFEVPAIPDLEEVIRRIRRGKKYLDDGSVSVVALDASAAELRFQRKQIKKF